MIQFDVKKMRYHRDMESKATAAKKKIEDAGNQVEDNIRGVQNTSIGKSIPTQIKDVKVYDLLKYTWLFSLTLDLALLLIIDARREGSRPAFKPIAWLLKISFLICGVLGDIMSGSVFILGMSSLFKFMVLIKLLKALVLFVSLIISSSSGIMYIFSGMFGVLVVAIDILFVFYLCVYLDRLESDEYDAYGAPTQKEDV